ncbi:unnamed protein product [Closterium sp. NIES-54]
MGWWDHGIWVGGTVGDVAGASGVGGAGARDPIEPGAARVGAGGTGAGGTGAGGAGAGRAGAGGTGVGGAGDEGAGAGAGGTGAGGAGARGAGAVDPGGTVRPRPHFGPLLQQPASPLPAASPYTEQSGGLTERREPASRPVLPVCTTRHVPHSRPPPVPGTHAMALRPSSVPLRVPLPPSPETSLPTVPDPKSDLVRAACPTVSHLLATAVTHPSFESSDASPIVAELLDFARLRHCSYPDAPNIPTPRSYAEAITGPYSSQWQAAMDAEMASWKSTGTYVDEVPPHGANIVDGMWIFIVKRPPGSPPAFKARYIARGFSELRSYLGLQITRERAWCNITLTQSHMVHKVLQRFGFQFSSPPPTPLSTSHSLSAPPLDESLEPSGLYPELVGCLMYQMTCTRPDLTYPLSLLARYVAPGRHQKVHWDAAKRVLRYLCSTSGMGLVLGGRV